MRRMFSKKQIQEIVALMASKGELDFSNVDLKAKTLEQKSPNWSADIDSFPNITGGTSTPIFCRVQQINKELHIIMLGKIVNETESQISGYSTDSVSITLPQDIADKIYDVLGNKVSENPVSNTRITYDYASGSKSTSGDMSKYYSDMCMNVLNSTSTNKIAIMFQRSSLISIDAGETLYLESRVSLDLL